LINSYDGIIWLETSIAIGIIGLIIGLSKEKGNYTLQRIELKNYCFQLTNSGNSWSGVGNI